MSNVRPTRCSGYLRQAAQPLATVEGTTRRHTRHRVLSGGDLHVRTRVASFRVGRDSVKGVFGNIFAVKTHLKEVASMEPHQSPRPTFAPHAHSCLNNNAPAPQQQCRVECATTNIHTKPYLRNAQNRNTYAKTHPKRAGRSPRAHTSIHTRAQGIHRTARGPMRGTNTSVQPRTRRSVFTSTGGAESPRARPPTYHPCALVHVFSSQRAATGWRWPPSPLPSSDTSVEYT